MADRGGRHTLTADARAIFCAGIAVAIGAFGVVIASAFYAISPSAASLPAADLSIADALHGMVAGRVTMLVAGSVGVVSDLILATGTLLLMAFRKPVGLEIERAGWALVTMSVLVFVGVDSLSAGVLTQLAALGGDEGAFAGFKLLFNILFIAGTIAFGLGVPAILASEMNSKAPVLVKPLLWIGVLAAVVGLVGALLYFARISLPYVVGVPIAVGSLIFGIYGVQIARAAR